MAEFVGGEVKYIGVGEPVGITLPKPITTKEEEKIIDALNSIPERYLVPTEEAGRDFDEKV